VLTVSPQPQGGFLRLRRNTRKFSFYEFYAAVTETVAKLPASSDRPTCELSGRRLWLMLAGLGVVAAVVLFFKLGDFRTFGTHETYAVVPAREMLESGDWIVPRSGGLPRLRKPPLNYWVVAGAASLFGEMNEWTVRVPAAVSSLLLATLIGIWAARWYGRTAGLGAALVQLTSAWVIIYARKAEVDMLLCLLTTAALFLVANGRTDEPRSRSFLRWVAVYALLSLSWMAKFHYGPAMVLIPCGLYFVIQRRYRSLLQLANPVGLLMMAVAVVVWPYLVLQQMPEAWGIWKQETVGRAVGAMNRLPLWFYVPYLLWLPLPWTGLVYFAMPASWRKAWQAGDARERFLWVWAVVHLAIVTVSADKHKHYLNAMLPMFSLLAGQSFVRCGAWIRMAKPRLDLRAAIIGTLLCLATTGGALMFAGQKWASLIGPITAVCVTVCIGGIAVSWWLAARKPGMAGCTAIVAFLAGYAGVMGWIMPARDHRQQSVAFAYEVRRELTAQQEIVAFRMDEKDPLVYYLGSRVSRLQTVAAVKRRLAENGRLFLVTYEPFNAELADLKGLREVKRLQVDGERVSPKHPPLVMLELTRPRVVSRDQHSQ
jgi:4-amino-4-deoxy-L-arabinose transferase-like glycosyltransferase